MWICPQVPDPTQSSPYLPKKTAEFSVLIVTLEGFSTLSPPRFSYKALLTYCVSPGQCPVSEGPLAHQNNRKTQEMHLDLSEGEQKTVNCIAYVALEYPASFTGKSKPQKHKQANLWRRDWYKMRRNRFFFSKHTHFVSQQLIISSLLQTTLWSRGVQGWPLGTGVSHLIFTGPTTINSPNQKGTGIACFFQQLFNRGCLGYTFTLLGFCLIFHL